MEEPSDLDAKIRELEAEAARLKKQKKASERLSSSSTKVPVSLPGDATLERRYSVGTHVLYYSKTYGKWIPSIVENVRECGGVELRCRKGNTISVKDQATCLKFDEVANTATSSARHLGRASRLPMAPSKRKCPQPLTEENVIAHTAAEAASGTPREIRPEKLAKHQKITRREAKSLNSYGSIAAFMGPNRRAKRQENELARIDALRKQTEMEVQKSSRGRGAGAKSSKRAVARDSKGQSSAPGRSAITASRRNSTNRFDDEDSNEEILDELFSEDPPKAKRSRVEDPEPKTRGRPRAKTQAQPPSKPHSVERTPVRAKVERTPAPTKEREPRAVRACAPRSMPPASGSGEKALPVSKQHPIERTPPPAKVERTPPPAKVEHALPPPAKARASGEKIPLDREEKHKLQEKIDLLSEDSLDKVLRFLETDLSNEDDEEFDLDLDLLAPNRQHQLVEVVDEVYRKQQLRQEAHNRGERTPPDSPAFDPNKDSLLTPAVNDTPQFTPQPTPVEPTPLELGVAAVPARSQASESQTPCPTPSPALNAIAQQDREPSPDPGSASSENQASPRHVGKTQLQQLVVTAPANATGSPSPAAVQGRPSGTQSTVSHAASHVSSATRSPETREAEDIFARAVKKAAKHTPELRESKTPRQQAASDPALTGPSTRQPDSMLDVLDVAEVLAIAEELPGSASGRSGEKA